MVFKTNFTIHVFCYFSNLENKKKLALNSLTVFWQEAFVIHKTFDIDGGGEESSSSAVRVAGTLVLVDISSSPKLINGPAFS